MNHIGPEPTPEMYQSGYEIDCQCARCGGMIESVPCEHCVDGFDGHECGEDCCACAFPEPNCICQYCYGDGHRLLCCNSWQWCIDNPLPDRENVLRHTLEWFATVAYDTPGGMNDEHAT